MNGPSSQPPQLRRPGDPVRYALAPYLAGADVAQEVPVSQIAHDLRTLEELGGHDPIAVRAAANVITYVGRVEDDLNAATARSEQKDQTIAEQERQIAELEAAKAAEIAALTHELNYDTRGTGVRSRRGYFDEAEARIAALAHSQPERRAVAVELDLDKFKVVNDTYGDAIGNEFLRQVAQALEAAIGDRGIFGRIGGDEFAAFLYVEAEDEAARQHAMSQIEQELLETVLSVVAADARWNRVKEEVPELGMTVGFSAVRTGHEWQSVSLDEAMLEANTAVKKQKIAKHGGEDEAADDGETVVRQHRRD